MIGLCSVESAGNAYAVKIGNSVISGVPSLELAEKLISEVEPLLSQVLFSDSGCLNPVGGAIVARVIQDLTKGTDQ